MKILDRLLARHRWYFRIRHAAIERRMEQERAKKRSEAAKKGWQTRRRRKHAEMDAAYWEKLKEIYGVHPLMNVPLSERQKNIGVSPMPAWTITGCPKCGGLM